MKKLFIEISKEKRSPNGNTGIADIREATQEEIKTFLANPCDHTQKELLIYDEDGFMYNNRFCAVCDSIIGLI